MDAGPSDEEFVAAVILAHERLHANLRELARGDGWVNPMDPGEDEVIQAYCAAHGVAVPESSVRKAVCC